MSAPFTTLPAGIPAGPRTPEPLTSARPPASDDARPPSPPRPRLRLKRRPVPHLSAPTQNFLASVAAADVPIPSIEEPEQDTTPFPSLFQFDRQPLQLSQFGQQPPSLPPLQDGNFLCARGHTFSPPKTPAPGAMPSTSPSRYPDWSIDSVFSSSTESSPDREFGSSRPSTARSTQTSSSSLFSRFSQLSDEEHCVSPEDEATNQINIAGLAGALYELRRNSASNSSWSSNNNGAKSNPVGPEKTLRKAPWTKAMTSHLWATYILYLQDPKVTPFRVGKSCVPPHGVLLRVAREAKRSWKGAKAMLAKAPAAETNTTAATLSVPATVRTESVPPANDATQASDYAGKSKSGSSTPTAAESRASSVSGTFIEWPHTNAATRAHLRELCRLKATTPGSGARGMQYMSRSPTPFSQASTIRHRNLRTTTAQSEAFATKDMTMSLALSTSEAMQPQGPLAQLTQSGSGPQQNASSSFPPLPVAPTISAIDSAHTPALISVPTSAPGPASFPSRDRTLSAPTPAPVYGAAAAATAQNFAGRLTTAIETEEPSFAERQRLGSPFTARSYGPSSSSSLAAVLSLSTNSRQPHTISHRRTLQSPVRLSRAGPQKRRTKHLSQDLRRRPGLGSDFFTEPSIHATSSLGAELDPSFTRTARGDELFIPRPGLVPSVPPVPLLPTLTSSSSAPELASAPSAIPAEEESMEDSFSADPFSTGSFSVNRRQARTDFAHSFGGLGDAAQLQPPARLGSPFAGPSASNTSFSFPNRFSQATDFDSAPRGRPFATVQRVPESKAVPARANLASRLAYLDQRLREFNNRSENRPHQPGSSA